MIKFFNEKINVDSKPKHIHHSFLHRANVRASEALGVINSIKLAGFVQLPK